MSLGRLVRITIRTMYKPAVNYVKKRLANNYHPLLEAALYNLGKYCYRAKIAIKRRISPEEKRVKEMERNKVVEYGALIFFEYICTTGVLIGLSLYKLWKGVKTSREDKQRMIQTNNYVLGMREDLTIMKRGFRQLKERNKDLMQGRAKVQDIARKDLAKVNKLVDELEMKTGLNINK